jgi:hypothetical protein
VGRSRYDDTETEDVKAPKKPPSWRCTLCLDADPQIRYTHLIDLAMDHTFEAIEAHLWDAFRAGTVLPESRIQGYVADRVAWVKDQVLSYSGIPDEETGAPMPWHVARRKVHAQFRAARGAAPPPPPPVPEPPPAPAPPPTPEPQTDIPEPASLEDWHKALDEMVGVLADDYTPEEEDD